MPRVIRSHAHEYEWTHVSERRPCPLCDATSECQLDADGQFVCCARRPSEWRLTNGAWLHHVDDAPSSRRPSTMPGLAEVAVDALEGR